MRLLDFFGMILFVSMMLVLTSCLKVQNAELTGNKRLVVENPKKRELEKNKKSLIEIQEAKIMGWWWKKEVAEKGFDGDNPPPKENYLEIVTWQYDGEGLTTYPKEVDFISKVENKSNTKFEGVMTYYLKSRFGDNSNDIYCEDYPWQDEKQIFEQNINLDVGQSKVFKKLNYDLHDLLIKEFNENRICSLKLEVKVFDIERNKIIEKQTIMPIILGD